MHYWREQFFETLKAAAAAASSSWPDYANFCLEYERGLRAQAFLKLDQFMQHMEREPFPERRRFVSWLMNIADGQEGSHMLIPHPLKVRVVEPTLLEWTVVEPASSEPHRWIGDYDHLEKAIELNPEDQIALRRYVILLLGLIGYATHELPYGFIGEPSQSLAHLDKIDSLLPRLKDDSDRAAYAADVVEERHTILEYLRSRS